MQRIVVTSWHREIIEELNDSFVAHHYVVNSGVWELMNVETDMAKTVWMQLFGMWGKTAINSFVGALVALLDEDVNENVIARMRLVAKEIAG